jgi:endonuclease I
MFKQLLFLLTYLTVQLAFAQQPYYDDVDLTLTGQDLYFELQNKINIANNTFTYGDVKNTVKITDEDPNNTNNVLLIYGYNDADGNCTTDRSRDKNDFGGNSCQYNREHVFARSNANPAMGSVDNNTTGISADPHNLRPSDVQMNGNRGNKKFTDGSGNAGPVGSDWYPGDEWKGDVARMMMYMYTRYGDRCLPSLNAVGATQGSTDMLQLYLQWNVDDPVSDFEDQRNPYLETVYGNRNPFIDNPVLATIIWGGPMAEDRWNLLSNQENDLDTIAVYPNPANEYFWVTNTTSFSETDNVILYDIQGRKVFSTALNNESIKIPVNNLNTGIYILKVSTQKGVVSKKISVN